MATSAIGQWPVWHHLSSRKRLLFANAILLTLFLLPTFYFLYTNSPYLFQTETEAETKGEQQGVLIHENTNANSDANRITISTTTIYLPAPTSSSSSPPPPYDRTKLAFLVETRPVPHLPGLFIHMVAVIPAEWTFKFMGSPEAIAFMRASPAIRALESSGKLTILALPSNYSVSDREAISQMFTDLHLYKTILAPAEHLLVFQPDSIFCANSAKTLNDFLEWDWIGAPWSENAQFGWNGGLSLRKISKILQILEKEQRPVGDGALEDLWLSNKLIGLKGAKMPNATISKTFSVESVWGERPLGYHVGWLGVHHGQIWDIETQVSHILEYCPEVKLILGMRLDNDKPIGVTV